MLSLCSIVADKLIAQLRSLTCPETTVGRLRVRNGSGIGRLLDQSRHHRASHCLALPKGSSGTATIKFGIQNLTNVFTLNFRRNGRPGHTLRSAINHFVNPQNLLCWFLKYTPGANRSPILDAGHRVRVDRGCSNHASQRSNSARSCESHCNSSGRGPTDNGCSV